MRNLKDGDLVTLYYCDDGGGGAFWIGDLSRDDREVEFGPICTQDLEDAIAFAAARFEVADRSRNNGPESKKGASTKKQRSTLHRSKRRPELRVTNTAAGKSD
jgi:hypothetical protein